MGIMNDLFLEDEYGYGFGEMPKRVPDMDELLRESIARNMEHLETIEDEENLMLEQAFYAAWKKNNKEKKRNKKQRKKDE